MCPICHLLTPLSSSVMQPSTSLATLSPSPPGAASDPASLLPSLYQAVTGVGLPVAEQVSVTLPDTRPVTRAGGSSLNLTNLSPP